MHHSVNEWVWMWRLKHKRINRWPTNDQGLIVKLFWYSGHSQNCCFHALVMHPHTKFDPIWMIQSFLSRPARAADFRKTWQWRSVWRSPSCSSYEIKPTAALWIPTSRRAWTVGQLTVHSHRPKAGHLSHVPSLRATDLGTLTRREPTGAGFVIKKNHNLRWIEVQCGLFPRSWTGEFLPPGRAAKALTHRNNTVDSTTVYLPT